MFLNHERMYVIDFPDWDRDLFLYLNSKNHPWLDPLMILFSNQTVWILVLLAVILYIVYKKTGWHDRFPVPDRRYLSQQYTQPAREVPYHASPSRK